MKTRLLILLTFFTYTFASAQVYVNENATGANDGSTWVNAYTNLTTALANHTNTEIWIASGTYNPGASVTDKFIVNVGTELYGGFLGNETNISQRNFRNNLTILSADVLNNDGSVSFNTTRTDNNYRIAQVGGSGVIFDGLIFKGGNAAGSTNNDREGSALIIQKDTEVRNCVFEENAAIRGGTITVGGNQSNATVTITNSIFRNNLASFANTFYSNRNNVSLNMVNVLIVNNVNVNTGGVSGFGGVIWLRPPSGSNNLTMTNCTITDNTFLSNGTTLDLVKNTASGSAADFIFNNNIFWNNGNGYRAFHIEAGGYNTIVCRNNIDEDNFSNITDNNNDIIVANTLNTDPQFTDAATGDYKPIDTATAVNSGNNNLYSNSFPSVDLNGEQRIKGLFIDRGALESDLTEVALSSGAYVDLNATGNNDGTSWQDAYTNLETALNLDAGSFLWVAGGTYVVPQSNTPYQIFANTKIYGGFDGTESLLSERDYVNNSTIITGDINNDDNDLLQFNASAATKTDNANRVMIVRGAGVEIDGFTFTGGHAFDSAQGLQEGAGLIIALDTNVSNCIIENNTAQRAGAGIRVYDISGINSGVNTISNCIFRRNRSWFATAIYANTARLNHNVELLGCSFEDNISGRGDTTNNPAGIVWVRNEATGSPVTVDVDIVNCTVAGNEGTHAGAGRYPHILITKNSGQSNYRATNNIFFNNTQIASGNNLSTPVFSFTGGNRTLFIDTNIDEDNFSNLSNDAVNTFTSAPGFIDAPNGNYRIENSSFAAGSGDATLAEDVSETDFYSFIRNNNSTWDLGAYGTMPTASLDDFEQLSIKLFPNPTSSILNIESSNAQIEQISIYDILGKEVVNTKMRIIDVSKLKAGIYILNIKTAVGNVSKRFIKK